jgi:hypothetical protein
MDNIVRPCLKRKMTGGLGIYLSCRALAQRVKGLELDPRSIALERKREREKPGTDVKSEDGSQDR